MEKLNRFLTWPLLFLLLVPAVALAAPDVPTPDTDAAAWAKLLYMALTSKAWGVVVGLVLVAVVYPLRRWGGVVVPWFKTPFGGLALAFLVSLAGTMGVALAAGVAPTPGLIASALSTAAAAAGVWEWLKAHVPKVQDAADKAAELPVARVMSTSMMLMVVVGLVACGAQTKHKVEVAKDGVVLCVKADAPELLALSGELLADAAASLLKIGGVDWQALVAKAKTKGIELGGCAFAAIYNAFDKQGPEPSARSLVAGAQPLPRRQALDQLLAGEVKGFQLADGTVVR